MDTLAFSHRAPGELAARQRNFRTHPKSQIERLCQSIRDYGFNQPVAIDSDDRIVCGAALVEAAKLLGLNRVPVVVLDHLNEAQLRSYAVAANKLADLAGYDEAELAFELADIQALLGTHAFPELGIETPELDRLLGLADFVDTGDDGSAANFGPPISRPGDIWQLGRHRLMCGDALVSANYSALMAGELAQFVLSDVPYNLSADTISTTGRHGDFLQGAGEFSRPEFTRFLTAAMRNMSEWSQNGSLHMIFMSWHYLHELLRAGRIVYDELKGIITWVKPFPGLGSWYRSQTEFIVAFKKGGGPFINNLGPKGRDRGTAWEYDGMAGFGKERDELLAAHATPKPLDLIADAILDCSKRDGIVLDPFAGSGTICLAAERTGRVARAMELDAQYVDVALRRFRKTTDIEPTLLSTGETFAEREAQTQYNDRMQETCDVD